MFLSNDDMVECPYNRTHIMLRKRLQSHLLKCRRNYPDVELRKCPFNITHLIPEPEFEHHATNCPDRKLITQYKYDAPQPKEEDVPKHAPIECDENWDDTDVNDYDPQLYLDKANVIRKPDGANRSERKLFIKKERKRLGDGSDSSDEDSKSQRDNTFEFNIENHSCRSKDLKGWTGSNRSNPPSTSAYSRERSRSPKYTQSNRNHSRSPLNFQRSNQYLPPSSYSSQNAYYDIVGRNPNNNQYNSGRDLYFSNNNSSVTEAGDNSGTTSVMPEAPPPPIISYPSPLLYFSKKSKPSSRQ